MHFSTAKQTNLLNPLRYKLPRTRSGSILPDNLLHTLEITLCTSLALAQGQHRAQQTRNTAHSHSNIVLLLDLAKHFQVAIDIRTLAEVTCQISKIIWQN